MLILLLLLQAHSRKNRVIEWEHVDWDRVNWEKDLQCGDGRCLIEAAYTSNSHTVRELLERGVEKVNTRVHGGRTALHRVGYESESYR